MSRYTVYPTRWDDPHIVAEMLPVRGLEFTMPINDAGECTFSATVEPGKSFWRDAIAPLVSGILICRDGVPVWSGMVWSERQSGPRTFDFQCAEWSSFYERVPADAHAYSDINDHAIFGSLINLSRDTPGQDPRVQVPTTTGNASSDLTINAWDSTTVEEAFTRLAAAEDGPEWYFGTSGTLENPKRVLVLADRLGSTDPTVTLEYVEDSDVYVPPSAPPQLTTLGALFPGQEPQAVVGRRGGNVIAHPSRTRDGSGSATASIAIGAGEEGAQLRAYATSPLVAAGFPRLTRTNSYPDVTQASALQRHADADLSAVAGLVTSYSLATWDAWTDEAGELQGGPDWTQVQRGDMAQIILDTDVYGAERPVGGQDGFEARVLGIAVQVADDGPAQVSWSVSTTMEH